MVFRFVVASADGTNGFGDGPGQCPGSYGVVESCGAVGVDQRADLVEAFGCFSVALLEFGELCGLLALRPMSDMQVLREQTELFGPVASRPTAWRAVQAVASVELRAIPRAVAAARERVWRRPDSGWAW